MPANGIKYSFVFSSGDCWPQGNALMRCIKSSGSVYKKWVTAPYQSIIVPYYKVCLSHLILIGAVCDVGVLGWISGKSKSGLKLE